MACSEVLPPENKPYLAYSEIYGNYYVCKFSPVFGWVSDKNTQLGSITHWFDADIEFPWKIRNAFSRKIAAKYSPPEEEEDDEDE